MPKIYPIFYNIRITSTSVIAPSSPYIKSFCVVRFTPRIYLQHCKWILSIAFPMKDKDNYDTNLQSRVSASSRKIGDARKTSTGT